MTHQDIQNKSEDKTYENETQESTQLKNIIDTTNEQLVSADFNHNSHSSIVDLSLTKVADGKMAKISAWYDNEWGFANRMCDLAIYLGNLK